MLFSVMDGAGRLRGVARKLSRQAHILKVASSNLAEAPSSFFFPFFFLFGPCCVTPFVVHDI